MNAFEVYKPKHLKALSIMIEKKTREKEKGFLKKIKKVFK